MLQTINYQKEIQTKLAKRLLDMLILQMLNRKPMHGYQIITETRKDYGVYCGPSKIYPLLATLEKKGYLNSTWSMTTDKPRKIFSITTVGKNTLKFTEDSLNNICKNLKAP